MRGGLSGRLHPPHARRAGLRRRPRCSTSTPQECIDCDACVEACPVDAIFAEDQVPEEWQRYIELNAAYYRNQAA